MKRIWRRCIVGGLLMLDDTSRLKDGREDVGAKVVNCCEQSPMPVLYFTWTYRTDL